jgi:transcriptional regulator with XRE-family HTH domain
MSTETLFDRVVTELRARHGENRKIAQAAGVNYDTLMRIKAGDRNAAYAKVQRLADVLFGKAKSKAREAA